ncbi:zinc finger protein 350-like isoform X2 [Bacillus rossius redtenbacheri]|uniref:zinc finger protein 350-like isoform X2 n=1 Tax=Bacillus rossius redtenbacheri TaxID=93214 RepID=UPI002FDD8D68
MIIKFIRQEFLVFEGDGLPSQICEACLQKVNSCFSFKLTCERSDARLRQSLGLVQSAPRDGSHEGVAVETEFTASIKEERDEEDDSLYNFLPQELSDGSAKAVLEDFACGDYFLRGDSPGPCRPDSPLNLSVAAKSRNSSGASPPVAVKQEASSVKMEADTSVAGEPPSSGTPAPRVPLLEYEGLLGKLVETMYAPGKSVLMEKCANAPAPLQQCGLGVMGSLLLYQTLAGGLGGRPFRCHLCGKAFRKKSGLSDHVRAHLNRKAYKCRYCWKSYAQRAGLRSHERLHEGTQAFVCRVCQKAFTQRSHLVEHLRIHTGERPYACRACDRTFAKSWNLKCHEKSHCLLQTQALNTCC